MSLFCKSLGCAFYQCLVINKFFNQRYLVADEFHTTGGPVFVLLGGPWKIDGELAVNGSMGLMGRELGAVLVDLEHRYYGKSKPTE